MTISRAASIYHWKMTKLKAEIPGCSVHPFHSFNNKPSSRHCALFKLNYLFFYCTVKMKGSPIGERGTLLAKTPFLPYKDAFMKCLQDPFHSQTNPNGYIALCVAENKLILEELSQYLSQPHIAQIGFGETHKHLSFCYSNFLGLTPLRESMSNFLTRKFVCLPETSLEDAPHIKIKPENVVVGSGCAGLLNVLFCLLTNEKDAVLIPAPYYAAFDNDMKAIAHCIPVPVTLSDGSIGPSPLDLAIAKEEAESKGLRVKILLLTNPHNPLGVVYQPSVIRSCIEWARTQGMHTIVDEIYALSIHSNNSNFHSVLNIMGNKLGDDVHMLWALSKDFGSSGLRLGFLYTQNDTLLKAIETISAFSAVSHPMQLIAAHMLADYDFVDTLLENSRKKLCASYDIVVQSLKQMNIPFIPASAGIFVYCDFSFFLPQNTFAGEARFSSFLVDVARVVMTPGESQHDSRPGFFRICYAAITPEALTVAMNRISSVAEFIRLYGWEQIEKIQCYEDLLIGPNKRIKIDSL